MVLRPRIFCSPPIAAIALWSRSAALLRAGRCGHAADTTIDKKMSTRIFTETSDIRWRLEWTTRPKGSISLRLVHLVQQRPAGEEAVHIVNDQPVMALPKPFRYGGGVRRDQHVVDRPEGRLRGQRLLIEDVQRGAGDPSVLERLEQRRFVDQRAAGHIDQVRVRLHLLQSRRIDDAGGGGS